MLVLQESLANAARDSSAYMKAPSKEICDDSAQVT